MQQGPSEADSHSNVQDVSRSLWNTKVYYRVHKSPLLEQILSQLDPAHVLTLILFKNNFRIIIPSISKSPNALYCSGFPT